MSNSKFLKKLTAAEVGNTKTHEVYIRIPNDFDFESFFNNTHKGNGSVIEVIFVANVSSQIDPTIQPRQYDLRFVYFANSNKEKRIPGLGPLFKEFKVNEGDVISLERRDYNGSLSFNLTFLASETLQLYNGALLLNGEFDYNAAPLSKMPIDEPLQVIYYGAPGTGKSFTIDDKTDEDNSIRITFHPDSDYASFVGAYKPTMENVPINSIYGESVQFATGKNGHPGTEKKIVYKYVPQAFLKAYVAAWSDLTKPYFLIIEEINRGNCAQIFGDLFQLLDRNNAGSSSYAIHADEDISQFLSGDSKGFAALSDEQKDAIRAFELRKDNGTTQAVGQAILDGKLLLLPPNLYIWATMNTSDQSLFPIDSAFKRRWNWKYIPIDYTKKQWQFEVGEVRYLWSDFLRKINPLIHILTESADKQMGYFFVKADKKTSDEAKENDLISEDIFLNKVLFYLWTDVLKDFDAGQEPFIDSETHTTYNFSDFFDYEKGKTKIAEFVSKLELTPVGNGESDVAKIAAEVADDAKGSRLSVTFPGETAMKDGHISDIYVATLERIGLDRVFNVLKERTRKLPLITKEKIETNDTARRYRQVGDYYILLGPDVYPYHPTLRSLNNELSLGLIVQWDETVD